MGKKLLWLAAAVMMMACSDQLGGMLNEDSQLPLRLSGSIAQENVTRANEQGFVSGDRMGIYVVDRVNGEPGVLGAADNRAKNILYTFDGEAYLWSSPTSIYWRDNQTPIDIYGYYPGVNYISDPTAYVFEVQRDQSTEAGNGELSGYERSDLLWGKAANVTFTSECIMVRYHHILAGVRVQLQKGEGISDTEWEKLPKQLSLDNTVRSSTVNLSDGSISPGTGVSPINMAPQSGDNFRAIVIPQTVAAGKQLLSITIDGLTYDYSRETAMVYQSGKLHNFTMTVNKREPSGDYEISVTDDGITPWVNDESSHQFTAMAYVTVNCPQYGKLKQCITDAGYDYKTLQNLKVTGELTQEDLIFLGQEMLELHHLNLKEVKMKHVRYYADDGHPENDLYGDDNFPGIPNPGVLSIRSVMLPQGIKRIWGMNNLRLMYSTLEIPEGVTFIGDGSFEFQEYNGVELILPNTLDSIGASAFYQCGYKCELKLSDNISYIGQAAFGRGGSSPEDGCPNFYGVFHLPSKIKTLYTGMFNGLGGTGKVSGTIELPQGLTETPDYDYWGGWAPGLSNRIELILPSSMKRIGRETLGGDYLKLQLNEGLEEIGSGNFNSYGSPCSFPLVLPSTLRRIDADCFRAGYEGELTIPEGCLTIGSGCFAGNSFSRITLPSRLEVINKDCFRGNDRLSSVTIPQYVDYIGEGAFNDCDILRTVICLAKDPPELGGPIFQGTYFDNIVLQVPETSVETYRHTDGWKDFKSITAYHELAFNLSEITCIDKGITREGVIRSEGAWEVSECPDWVTVTPSSGTADERKVEVTVTVNPLGSVTADREGRVVFRLKDKNYTTYTTVKQRYLGDIGEDQKVVLQTASAGAPRAIPIFIVGEGYDADDVVSGQYLEDMRAQMEHLFSCEPYKTYRNYFTVSTAIAVSPEHGISGETRFQPANPWESKDEVVWEYAKAHGVGITEERAGQCTVLVLYNSNYLGDNHSSLREDGRTISYLGKSTDTYPFEQRSYVLREVGGIAFGHLGVEGINHFTFLKSCTCPSCAALEGYKNAKRLGWYDNISISGKMNDVLWSHLIFDERFAQQVDIYEGAYNHARGVYRSENMSIMGNAFIPYFNTISRQSIVKRILEYSGEGYSFEKFIAKDKMEIPEE